MNHLTVLSAGPSLTVQDLGRTRTLGFGLSRGGAIDRIAILEAAALLGAPAPLAAIEMAGTGGRFATDAPVRISLTGAPMRASMQGRPLKWNASHLIPAGATFEIGAAVSGVYGYLAVGGGFATREFLGSRSAHLTAGIGKRITPGDRLPINVDNEPAAPAMRCDAEDRCSGGLVRIVEGPQTSLYSGEIRERFASTVFRRSTHGNRQGIRLEHDGAAFPAEGQLGIVSDVIVPGDIQMTGNGIPFILGPECQTMGGYPRIGTVIPDDLPKVFQAAPGTSLQFRFVSLARADQLYMTPPRRLESLRDAVQPLVRDPHDIADLLRYQLIGGITAGDDLEGS